MSIHGTKELRTCGNEDIATIAFYYAENHYSTLPMKKSNWPYNSDDLFNKEYSRENRGRKISKSISKMLKENSDDVKGITLLHTTVIATKGK